MSNERFIKQNIESTISELKRIRTNHNNPCGMSFHKTGHWRMIIRSNFPYCIQVNNNILNRYYTPLGAGRESMGWGDDFPLVSDECGERIRSNLCEYGDVKEVDGIGLFLFDDSNPPWADEKCLVAYLGRLKVMLDCMQ